MTKMFNSKLACSSRTYEYLLPTYAFAPYAVSLYDPFSASVHALNLHTAGPEKYISTTVILPLPIAKIP